MTKSFQAIIFDIDNVLIDTRASYTDCIIKTVETYLETVLGFQPSRNPLLSRNDVEAFKSLGGFNDDWDTCYGFLLYFLSLRPEKHTIHELKKQKDVMRFVSKIDQKPLGIARLARLLRPQIERCLAMTSLRAKRSNLNELVSITQVADIFQRYYLSDFVWNEKLMIQKSLLSKLKKAGLKLGIVTGRSREEANFALRRFQIDRLFDAVVTADDMRPALKKPHPYGLLKAADKLGKQRTYLYIGDLPDDIVAAERAKKKIKIKSCGFLATSGMPKEMKAELKKSGADYLVHGTQDLKKIICSSF